MTSRIITKDTPLVLVNWDFIKANFCPYFAYREKDYAFQRRVAPVGHKELSITEWDELLMTYFMGDKLYPLVSEPVYLRQTSELKKII